VDFYCPPGSQNRDCDGGEWGSWSTCESASGKKYYGDGGTRCGDVVCLQISGYGGNTTVPATITKNGGGAFVNDVEIVIYSPSTSKVDFSYYYCNNMAGKTSKTIYIDPEALGVFEVSDSIAVNVQLYSPCDSGATYISGNAVLTQCKQ